MGCSLSSNIAVSHKHAIPFSNGGLPADHPFAFKTIIKDLKNMPDVEVNNVRYGMLHTGGFTRVSTDKCRLYWIAQNTTEHTTPDWKFHVSVHPNDLPRAWDLVVNCFLESGLFGMKMCLYSAENQFGHWSVKQNGREITVYIYIHDTSYDTFYCEDKSMMLSTKDELAEEQLHEFVSNVASVLDWNSVQTNGLADGDRRINHYVSIRNEAFVKIGKELCYPPNDYGWNACKHHCPIQIADEPMIARVNSGSPMYSV